MTGSAYAVSSREYDCDGNKLLVPDMLRHIMLEKRKDATLLGKTNMHVISRFTLPQSVRLQWGNMQLMRKNIKLDLID